MVDPLKCHRFESRSSWRRNFLTAGRVWLAIEYHRRSSIRTALTLTEAGDDANFNLNLGIGGEKWAWAGRHRFNDSPFRRASRSITCASIKMRRERKTGVKRSRTRP